MSRWKRKSLQDLVISAGSGGGLRHVVLHAKEIYRRCNQRGHRISDTAMALGVGAREVGGLRAMMRQLRGVPAPERLACVVYTDEGWSVQEVAELFGRSDRWAQLVYDQQDSIREEFPVLPRYERAAAGMLASDPTMSKLWSEADRLRQASVRRVAQVNKSRKVPNIRQFTGRLHHGSVIFRSAS